MNNNIEMLRLILIDLTELGIAMLCNEEHQENAESPVLFTLSPIVTSSNPEQNKNSLSSIDVTKLRIVILYKLGHDRNAELPIFCYNGRCLKLSK